MGKVIRIDEYRRHASAETDAGREIWSCGVCGGSTWTITTAGHLHCSHCDTAAANLQIAPPAPERRAPMPWSALAPSGQWWWTWAPQS